MPSNAVIQILNMFSCNSPVFPGDASKMLVAWDTENVGEVFKKMIEAKIQAIPVMNKHEGKLRFVLTVGLMVEYFLNRYTEADLKAPSMGKLKHLFESQGAIKDLPVDLHSKLKDVWQITEKATVAEAARLMIQNHTHRVIVLNEKEEVCSMVTQSRILRLCACVVDQLPCASKTIRDLKLGSSPVHVIDQEQTAYAAFKKMIELNISAIGIVDQYGVLIGNVSYADIKLIGYDGAFWENLGLPLRDYLRALHGSVNIKNKHLYDLGNEAMIPLLTVTEDFTLDTTLKKMNFYEVHRLYVVDKDQKPLRIITTADILKEIMQ